MKKRWYMAYDPMESLSLWMKETGEEDVVKAIREWNAAQEPLPWRIINWLRGLWKATVDVFIGGPF